jgi:hypothetical protein
MRFLSRAERGASFKERTNMSAYIGVIGRWEGFIGQNIRGEEEEAIVRGIKAVRGRQGGLYK